MGVIAQEGDALSRVAYPDMEEVSKQTDQTCNLYTLVGYRRLCIKQVTGAKYIRRYSFLGARYPLHCRAGKLLLACAGEDFINDFFREVELKKYTENTITDEAQVRAELPKIREKGYSISLGERDPSTAMVSMPLYDYTNKVVASITVSGPAFYYTDENVKKYMTGLRTAFRNISRKMGYAGHI